jgi:hypothetical protein
MLKQMLMDGPERHGIEITGTAAQFEFETPGRYKRSLQAPPR